MKKKRHPKNLIIALLIIIVVVLTIVFLITSTKVIKVANKDNLSLVSWDIHFENLNERTIGNTIIVKHPKISKKSTYIGDYEVILTKPEDSVIFEFDVVNNGTLDAKLINIVKPKLKCISEENNKKDEEIVCNNLKYTLKYQNGKDLKEYDKLDKNERVNLVLTLKYAGNMLSTSKVKIYGLDIIMLYNQK